MDFAGLDNPNDINIAAAVGAQNLLKDQDKNNNEQKNNRIQQSLIAMDESMQRTYGEIDGNLTALGNSVTSSLENIGDLRQAEQGASIALAKASGADFVELHGTTIPLHVNTVYRRQFDVTQLRYTEALDSAKRAAYLARLAIEERLGVRMDELSESIGPLQAPSLWVDDLCTVQGVDYEALRKALPPDTADRTQAEKDAERGFANQFVGDYVARLKEFVEFYNLQFPFSEGGDASLISLKADLHPPGERCTMPSANLLLHSDHLDQIAPGATPGPSPSRGGWGATGCDDNFCPEALSGQLLHLTSSADSALLDPPVDGGVTWLRARARLTDMIPGAAGDPTGSAASPLEPPVVGAPSGYLFQTVELGVGKQYVLSWWDQARTATGSPLASGEASPLRVAVFDVDWNLVAADSVMPGAQWSQRRSLFVAPPADGSYHVGLSPALASEAGSVAIANVQLEEAQRLEGGASEYVSNEASRMRPTSRCSGNAVNFLDRFEYTCSADECWHVLKDPLVIDVEAINQGGSSLTGKIAQGNFNHRVGGIAVNLVGTGLRDCSGLGADCYSTGYVEYDLEQASFNIPLEDYSERVRCFNFGQGSIRSGKALATERVLTLPLGTADKELITTSPFLKSDLRGRPLSGVYHLRIKDAPGLVWDNVEDIQLFLDYQYWSRVATTPSQ